MINKMRSQCGLHPFITLGYLPKLPHFSALHVPPAGTPASYWCWCPKAGSKLGGLATLMHGWLRICTKACDQTPWGMGNLGLRSDGNLAFRSLRHLQRSRANFVLVCFFHLLFVLNCNTPGSFQAWELQHGLELLVSRFNSVVCFSNYLS